MNLPRTQGEPDLVETTNLAPLPYANGKSDGITFSPVETGFLFASKNNKAGTL